MATKKTKAPAKKKSATTSNRGPRRIILRTYNVGFGDCFLLTFRYATRDRHILIDFGSTRAPEALARRKDFMADIARDIEKQCGGQLDAVVATHRHKDHISGFTTGNAKSGDIIRALKPKLVIQPWTEDPKAAKNAVKPVQDPGKAKQNFIAGLRNLHQVAGAMEAASQRSWFGRKLKDQLRFLGDDNLPNKSAIDNLQAMAKNSFVYFGSKTGLERMLPGVKVYVLGPPTLEQTDRIKKQKSSDKDEFWMFASFWAMQAAAAQRMDHKSKSPFPKAATTPISSAPVEARWTIRRLRALQGEQLLSIVRALDKAMNNTSVILLFEVGKKRLLFPGDAQIENWSYALDTLKDKGKLQMLEDVDLYKVGHHGSRNATPKTLWGMFKKRSKTASSNRLRTVMSTKSGVHGKTEATAVPRRTLVDELKSQSELHDTQNLRASDGLFDLLEIDL